MDIILQLVCVKPCFNSMNISRTAYHALFYASLFYYDSMLTLDVEINLLPLDIARNISIAFISLTRFRHRCWYLKVVCWPWQTRFVKSGRARGWFCDRFRSNWASVRTRRFVTDSNWLETLLCASSGTAVGDMVHPVNSVKICNNVAL
jgi:hypothetical protein